MLFGPDDFFDSILRDWRKGEQRFLQTRVNTFARTHGIGSVLRSFKNFSERLAGRKNEDSGAQAHGLRSFKELLVAYHGPEFFHTIRLWLVELAQDELARLKEEGDGRAMEYSSVLIRCVMPRTDLDRQVLDACWNKYAQIADRRHELELDLASFLG